MNTSSQLFINFKTKINKTSLPKRFTFPFNYEPHPIALLAVKELQVYLKSQQDWQHNFGFNEAKSEEGVGKMFGVLVVRNKKQEIGYITAFSGKMAGKSTLPPFVPPVYERHTNDGFFLEEEQELNEINRKVEAFLSNTSYKTLKHAFEDGSLKSSEELTLKRKEIKIAKKNRDKKRLEGETTLSKTEYEQLCKTLVKESQDYQFQYKRKAKEWKQKLEGLKSKIENLEISLNQLKQERKIKSAILQENLFNQYQFLTIEKEPLGLFDIFRDTIHNIPPSGAGDCAAPKLLQYAFQNELEPICMAEFWWGKSPALEMKKHGFFYPACRGKCEPILGHMLKDMSLDPNPISEEDTSKLEIEIIYEDDNIAVINKPSGLLSIPGKKQKDSVATRMQARYPNVTSPLVVHRLDMSTSGIMLIAKSQVIHTNLQHQFLKHTIKKQYLAQLDGIIEQDSGTIDLPLRVDIDNRPTQIVCFENGKSARTHWQVIKREDNKTLIHFFPVTGRTHQLRVHAAHPSGLNTPITGDELYGKRNGRLHLHAESIEFIHPVTNKQMNFKKEARF